MLKRLTSFALLILTATAQPPPRSESMDLPAIIAATPELSHVHRQLQTSPQLNTSLSQIKNVTVFLGAGPYPTNIEYTIVDGLHPESSFGTNKAFLHTHLTDPQVTNVTGGQVIQIQKDSKGATTVVGGVRNNATVMAKIIHPVPMHRSSFG